MLADNGKRLTKTNKHKLSVSRTLTTRATRVRPTRKTKRAESITPHCWRLSLNVLCELVNVVYARDDSEAAGSEARGKDRERGSFD